MCPGGVRTRRRSETRQPWLLGEVERYRQKALQAAMRANQAKVRLSADYNGVPDYDPDYN